MKTKKMAKIKKAKESTLRTIRAAMEACEAKGIDIAAGLWGASFDDEKGYFVNTEEPSWDTLGPNEAFPACALGALLIQKNGSVKYEKIWGRKVPSTEEAASYILGVDEQWVKHFTMAFDGCPPDSALKPIFERDMSKKQVHDLNKNNKKAGRTERCWIFPRSNDSRVLEYRRAYKMGERLRLEWNL